MATNQGPSSNQTPWTKTPYQMPTVGNKEGAESSEGEWSASAGENSVSSGPSGNDGINLQASTENRSAQFKYPSRSQEQGAGANQYE